MRRSWPPARAPRWLSAAAVLRAEAEVGHQDPRAAGGARGAAEVARGAQPGEQGPAPGRLGARDFFEAVEGEAGSARRGGEAEDPGRAGRQARAVRLRADASACKLDHVVPVRQAFAGSVQILQALCGHSEKTLRESAQPTSLGSRVAPGVMEYARSPKLPPLVFEAQTCAKDSTYVGVDVVRCRRNGLANAPFPLPILCPADGVEPRRAAGCRTWGPAGTRRFRWPRCWTWASAAGTTSCWASPRGATWTRRRCGARWSAWKHMAKLSVNAMIGLSARSTEVVYSVRSSSSELDGAGADFSQAFAYEGGYGAGYGARTGSGTGMVWDFVYARRLLSNGTNRPIHDAVLGFEHCMVAKARRILDAPPRYLAQVKTDCLLTQRLPKRFTERLLALEALRHGLPRGRDEAVAGQQAGAAHGRRSGPNNGGGTGWTTL